MKRIANRPTNEQLRTEYWDKRKTVDEIALEVGCSRPTVGTWMKECGLPRRDPRYKKGCISWRKGKKFPPQSIEQRNKISESNKGKLAWNKGKKGEGNAMWGRHHTEETRRKMSEAKKGMTAWSKGLTAQTNESLKRMGESIKGENHWNWQGGITALGFRIRASFEYRQWRSDVFTRDDFTCQYCGKRGGKLNAHHKIPLSVIVWLNDIRSFEEAVDCDEIWNINNGKTLCRECHGKINIRRKEDAIKDKRASLYS